MHYYIDINGNVVSSTIELDGLEPITEAEFNETFAAARAEFAEGASVLAIAARLDRAEKLSGATAKLLALGLTQTEIDAMIGAL